MDMLIEKLSRSTMDELGQSTQVTQPAAVNDVIKFQHFMDAPSSHGYSIEMVTPTAHASLDRAAEVIRQRATDFVNQAASDRREIEAMGKDLLKNLDYSDPQSQVVMLSYSSKMMQSSTELTFMTNVGQSVEKNIKMLFQAQN